MKLVQATAGALALCLMVKTCRRLEIDDRLALVWVAVTATSYGFWSYSTQPGTYVLPSIGILLCTDIVIGLSDGQFSPKTLAWLGCLGAGTTTIKG